MKRKLIVGISLGAAMGCYAMVQIYQVAKRSFIEFSKPTTLKVVDSPNHKRKAVLLTFDCGTPCDLENSVALIPSDVEPIDDTGLIFRSFAGTGQQIVNNVDSAYPIWTHLEWKSNDVLSIGYDADATVDMKIKDARLNSRGHVSVIYKENQNPSREKQAQSRRQFVYSAIAPSIISDFFVIEIFSRLFLTPKNLIRPF